MVDIIAAENRSCKDISCGQYITPKGGGRRGFPGRREVDRNSEHDHAQRFHADSYHQLQTESYARAFGEGGTMQYKTQISEH